MGDHRASIKIKMCFHGVEKECDMWINYFPGVEYADVDDRIIKFIRDVYKLGMNKYNLKMKKYFEKESAKKKELEELAEYLRLKNKYG